MKVKYIVNFVLILIIFFFGTINIVADLTDNNEGSSGSLGDLGNGGWGDTFVGLKINILNSDGDVEDSEIILNTKEIKTDEHNFSTDMNPKFKQTDNTIEWTEMSNVTYYTSPDLPLDWNPNDKIINFDELLNLNNYELLKKLLNYTSNEGKIFTTVSAGDYIVVEPMTRIGKYYGTAFEFANSFDLETNCGTKGSFCYTYSGAVFGGSGSNNSKKQGGIFYQTLYVNEEVLDINIYSDNGYTSDARTERNNCFKDRNCGRGIGIFKYDDIVPPPPEPEPEKYTLDLNYCVDGSVDYYLWRYPANFSYDFELDGVDQSATCFDGSISSGTTYDISNIRTTTEDYKYIGYNVSSRGRCGVEQTGTSITGTVTQDTYINLLFESTCQKKLADIKKEDGTYNPSDLFSLYKHYFDKTGSEKKDYRGLLNINNPSCTTGSAPSKEINNLTCLSASTLSHANFNEVNLSKYDESIQDAYGNYIGFCLTSMYLKNNLGVQKFYSKSGQLLIKQVDDDSEIEIYNSRYNPVRVCGSDVATTTIRKMCYVLPGKTISYSNISTYDHVTLSFGDNNFDGIADILTKEDTKIYPAPEDGLSSAETTNELRLYEYIKETKYKLNGLQINKISGKIGSNGNITINGVAGKIKNTFSKIPFSIVYRGKTYGKDKNLCTYEIKEELIVENKLALEFRTVDTNKPFNRETMSNWSNGTDSSQDNDTVKEYINDRTNSYGIDKDGKKVEPLYTIKLTSIDIKNIRAYNKEVPYDNYLEECKEENGIMACKNTFIDNLKNGKVIIYDDEGDVVKTLVNNSQLISTTSGTTQSTVNSSYSESSVINGVDITKKICTPVTEATRTTGNVPNGDYNIGDEYVCEVAPGVRYNFFVVGPCGDDKVNMIMDSNLVNNIAWISEEDYFAANKELCTAYTYKNGTWVFLKNTSCNDEGPITILKALKEATKFWNNIVSYNYTLIDEIDDFSSYYKNRGEIKDKIWQPMSEDPDYELYSPIEQEDVKARLFTRNEANNCGCDRYDCPPFLQKDRNDGYWLSNAANTYIYMDINNRCASDIWSDYGDYSSVDRTDVGGIRPVITVYKSQISN